jgi:hypothetical protein
MVREELPPCVVTGVCRSRISVLYRWFIHYTPHRPQLPPHTKTPVSRTTHGVVTHHPSEDPP